MTIVLATKSGPKDRHKFAIHMGKVTNIFNVQSWIIIFIYMETFHEFY